MNYLGSSHVIVAAVFALGDLVPISSTVTRYSSIQEPFKKRRTLGLFRVWLSHFVAPLAPRTIPTVLYRFF